MSPRFREISPLLISFVLIAVLNVLGMFLFTGAGINYLVVAGANCLFFLVALLVFSIQRKALHNPNPNAFIRSVMKGAMLKLFLCMAIVLTYVLINRAHVNKPAIFISLGIYLVYMITEILSVMRLYKTKNG